MLTFRKIEGGAPSSTAGLTDYYLDQALEPEGPAPQQPEVAGYYTAGGEEGPVIRQDIDPAVARGLGVEPDRPLSRDEINALLAGRRADGDEIEGKHYKAAHDYIVKETGEEKHRSPTGSVDFTFTPDKSVSVAWAFAGPAEQSAILQAHREAAHAGMEYVEKHLAVAKTGDQGKDGYEPGHIAWIAFDHWTSRPTLAMAVMKDGEIVTEHVAVQVPGDPNIHTHFTAPNAIFTDSGRVGSFDLDRVRTWVKEGGAYYQAQLAENLRGLGAEVVLDKDTGAARLTAIPEHVRAHFSKKSANGEEAARAYARKHDLDWDTLSAERRVALLKKGAQNLPLGLDDEVKRKLKKDPLPAFEDWRRQAADLGWKHETVMGAAPRPELTPEQRIDMAYREALPWLERKLDKRAVLLSPDAREAACRGLIAAGITDTKDVDRVTKAFRDRGVRQYGETTPLVWGQEGGRKWLSVTTGLHEATEKEFIAKAKAAAADRSDALPRNRLDRAIAASGLDFDGDHGQAQRDAIHRLGEGGRLGVLIGAAGAGKTTLLKPLVSAWQEQGRRVYGTALAWRQADDLVDAGIAKTDVKAMDVFLKAAGRSEIDLDRRSVVVIDELSLLGTRQGLELLRLQDRHGFRLQMIGDDKQCQSIEAGPIIDLARKALGAEQVPEILTTVRQQTEREKEIVGLFRNGEAGKALEMKRADGTVELVPGGYRETVERAAKLVAERIRANAADAAYRITVSAPTNGDAHRIGVAIRETRRGLGQVGPDQVTIKAVATAEKASGLPAIEMPLAAGDRVRLFRSTKAEGQREAIGRNGSILTVLAADPRGMKVRNEEGTEGTIPWRRISDAKGRAMLAYGEVSTTHTAQGSTAPDHVYVLAGGSVAVNGFNAYSSGTRHRRNSYLLLSDGAERGAVLGNRAVNDVRPIALSEVWASVAANLGKQPEKQTATDFLKTAVGVRRGSVGDAGKVRLVEEGRARQGQDKTTLHDGIQRLQEGRGAGRVIEVMERGGRKHSPVLGRLESLGRTVAQAARRTVDRFHHGRQAQQPTISQGPRIRI